MGKLWTKLVTLIAPFQAIATELRIIRELYELDLSSRTPPVIRATENPSKRDTSVLWGEEDENKSKLKTMLEEWTEDDEQN